MLKKLWQARTTAFYSEPQEFERMTGVQGVAHSYQMPADISPLRLAALVPSLNEAEESLPVRMVFKLQMARLGVGDWKELDPAMLRYALAKEIVDLNPVLEDLNIDLTRHSGAVCLGAMSGYKPCDIEYFIKERSRGMNAIMAGESYKEPDHMTALIKRCQGLFGDQYADEMKWMPAPETAAHIHQELDRIYGVDQPAITPVRVAPPVSM